MLRQVVRFTEDAIGLEKTLRLFQGLCTVAVGLGASAAEVQGWNTARSQLAVSRRYFRLLRWHPCWTKAYASLVGQPRAPVKLVLDVGKWSFLGMYFFLEAFTITNMIGATSFEWGSTLQQEANKCWFYALVLSLSLGLYELVLPSETTSAAADSVAKVTPGSEPVAPPPKSSANASSTVRLTRSITAQTYTQIAVDSCDLFIPGSALGWTPVNPVFLGTTMVVSSLLAAQQIWRRL